MPDKIDSLTIFPKMAGPMRAGHIFRLHWILDLVADSSYCNISLLFKDVKTNAILIDTIQPELLTYCTVGSYFKDGKKLKQPPDDTVLEFTIDSTAGNLVDESSNVFSDIEYDLTLPEKYSSYSKASKKQFCFIQQVGNIKIVIPCFVLASTYYFKSTSLRNAIMSRDLESLFHSCSLDPGTRRAVIELKPGGNIGDAKTIARLELDGFARQRWKICINHLYVNKGYKYQSLKFDFPVEQKLAIKARGRLVENPSGGKTFIAFQILREDSHYPFDTIEIIYEKEETTVKESEGYPVTRTKHNGRRSERPPSDGLVRHILENCVKVENPVGDKIKETKIAIPKTTSENPSQIVNDERETELSLQPGYLNDGEVSRGEVKEKEDAEKKLKHVSSLLDFKKMVDPLDSLSCVIKFGKVEIPIQVSDFDYSEGFVWKREHSTTYLTLKESYDNTPMNRRRCAYVFFTCQGRHVCLVEIDQSGFRRSSCSTMVLISKNIINKDVAESAVKGFVENDKAEDRAKKLAKKDIILKSIKHPSALDDSSIKTWQALLLRKVLEDQVESSQ